MFKETLTRSKYLMILHTVLLLLATTIPTLNILQRMEDRISDYDINSIISGLTMSNITVFTSVVISVITIIYMFSYLFKFNSVQFYNSLPYKRECIYFTKFTAGLVSVIIPLVITFLANSMLFSAAGLGRYFSYTLLLKGLGIAVLSYLSVMSLGAFAASVSGCQFAVLIVMGFVYLVYPASIFGVMASVSEWFENLTLEFNFEICKYFFPPSLIYDSSAALWGEMYDSSVTWQGAVYTFIFSAVFFAAGLICYKFRKSENTQKFFAFTKIGSVLKYYVSAVGSLCFGAMFLSMSYGDIKWLGFIGYMLTLFIVFSAMQAIFEKNMRLMFKNIKNFAVFAGIWMVMLIVVLSGAVSNIKPSAIGCSEIRLYVASESYNLRDRENIERAIDFFNKNGDEEENSYMSIEINPNNPFFTLSFHTSLKEDEANTLKEEIFNSKEYPSIVERTLDSDWNYLSINGAVFSMEYMERNDKLDEIFETLKSEIGQYDYKTAKSSGIYATIRIRIRNRGYDTWDVNIYNCYKNTVEKLAENRLDAEDFGSLEVTFEGRTIFETDKFEEADVILRSAGGESYEWPTVEIKAFTMGSTYELNIAYDILSDEAKALINPEKKSVDELFLREITEEDITATKEIIEKASETAEVMTKTN